MRRVVVVVLFLAVTGPHLVAQDSLDELANSPELAFGEDISQPFLIWDVSGGLRMAPPADFKPSPLVTIWPDGRIRAGSDRPGVEPRDGKLTREELYQLLQFVVIQNRFYEANTDEIRAAIEQAGNGPRIADAMTSRFSLNLKRGKHAVQVYALGFNLNLYPQLEVLQRLFAIETRLRNLSALVRLGDRAVVKAMLATVNRELNKKHPDLPPMEKGEVLSVRSGAQGEQMVVLSRQSAGGEAAKPRGQLTVVYEKKNGEAEPRVTIHRVKGK